jgi:hypothetical protein
MINYLKSSMLSATYFMVFCTGQWLKLLSFHHVMHDNRSLIKRVEKLKKKGEEITDEDHLEELCHHFNI